MIELNVLGGVDLRSTEAAGARQVLAQPKRFALLVYLTLAAPGRSVRRDSLLALFWPDSDEERARSSLRSSLHFLRRSLGEPAIETIGADEVRIASGVVRCDALDFVGLCEREAWLEALDVYRGPLLPGFFVTGAPEWERWLEGQRDRLRRMATGALGRAAEIYEAAGELGPAAEVWRRVLVEEPHRLEPVLRLMDVLAAAGERAAAIAEGNAFQARMRREYDADPDPEVARRVEALRAAGLGADAGVPGKTHVGRPSDAGAPSRTGVANGAGGAHGATLSGGSQDRGEGSPGESEPSALGRLPYPPTPLIGRDIELTRLLGTLSRKRTRLLTLTGPGGIGKTRLALSLAAEARPQYPDGVRFVDLAPLSDPTDVVPAIASAFGVPETSGVGPVEAVARHLSGRSALAVVDNFEHVIEAAPEVGRLIEAATGLKVLATSREPLRLLAEQEYPVTPLRPYAAVELFVARARTHRPDFELSDRTAPVVGEICRRLDFLPLAIELAGARVKLFSPVALLRRLETSLGVLTGGARDLPARHQTLRAAIAWSYNLLGPEERRLFDRLAVFAGGFTTEAAEAICGLADPPLVDVLLGLGSLIDKNLLVARGDEASEGRLGMLETIHEFAREGLAESDEGEAIRSRHAAFYADRAEEGYRQLRGPTSPNLFDAVAAEHENFRAALAWALSSGETEIALRMAGALQPYWQMRGHQIEARDWLSAALEADHGPDSHVRAEALCSAGFLAMGRNDFPAARSYGEQSLELFRRYDNRHGIATILHLLGLVASQERELDRADAYLEEMLALRREDGSNVGIALALGGLGMVASQRGEYHRAADLYTEALALERAAGDRPRTWVTLLNLGVLEIDKGDFDQATVHLRESLDVCRQIDFGYGIALGFFYLAAVAGKRGHLERSARLFAAGDSLMRAIGRDVEPSARSGIDKNLAAARAQMAPDAWRAAWAEGEAMPLDEAIDYALEDGAGPEAPSPP